MDRSIPGKKVCAVIGAGAGLVGAVVFALAASGELRWIGMDVDYAPMVTLSWQLWNLALPAVLVAVPCGAWAGAVIGAEIGGWRLAVLGIGLAAILSALVPPLVVVVLEKGEWSLNRGWYFLMLALNFGRLLILPASFAGLAAAAVYRGALLAYRRRSVNRRSATSP